MPDPTIFPPAACTNASSVDTLFLVLLAVTVVITGMVFGLGGWFVVKYRRRAPDEHGAPNRDNHWVEIAWIVGAVLIDLGLFAWGTVVFLRETSPPADALPIYVVGQQWMWKIEHPSGRRSINELVVPAGRPVELIMTSQDVIHSFFVPAFRMKRDVYPGRYTHMWFDGQQPGTYHLFCAEYCGTDHSRMRGVVRVLPAEEYARWTAEGAVPSMAARGKILFDALGCASCHGEGQAPRGPQLGGLFGRAVELQGGAHVVADESYLQQAVLRPQAQIVRGDWPAAMPSFQGQLSAEELTDLIGYLKTLEAR